MVVEKLPGVKKADLEALKNAKKPVEAREELASRLLFGNIVDTIMKERKVAETAKKQGDEGKARAAFIGMFKPKK